MRMCNHTRRDFLKTMALGAAAMTLPRTLFAAEKSGAPSFRIVQMCDTQLGVGGYDHDVKSFTQAVSQINAIKPDLVLICGDLVHTPNETSFADFNRIKAAFTMPCHCAPGNHDVGDRPTRDSLQYYRTVVGKDFYSFEHKGYVFVIVNSSLWKAPLAGESEMQDSWLEATVNTAANKGLKVVVAGHYPLFLKDPDEGETPQNIPVARRGHLLDLFETHGVVAMLGGHTHRLIINDHKGMQLVNGETTSKNADKRPLGFRVWNIADPRPYRHDLVSLEGFQDVAVSSGNAGASAR